MTETQLGTIPVAGTLVCMIGAYLYMLGGRSGKWRRRFVGSLFCATAVWIEALLMGVFHPLMLAIYPLLIGAFHMGYGADVDLEKIQRRLLIVFAIGMASALMAILMGCHLAWLILGVHFVIGFMSVVLGVWNPIYAAPEEFFVCMLLTWPLAMYPFVKC